MRSPITLGQGQSIPQPPTIGGVVAAISPTVLASTSLMTLPHLLPAAQAVQEANRFIGFAHDWGGKPTLFWEDAQRRVHPCKREEMRALLANRFVDNGAGSCKPLFPLWEASPHRRTVAQVIYDPTGRTSNGSSEAILNLWRGFARKPRSGTWDLMGQHLYRVVCGGNAQYFSYLLGWMAHLVQRPWEAPGVVIVLRSQREGTGKTTVLGWLSALLGIRSLQRALEDEEVPRQLFKPDLKQRFIEWFAGVINQATSSVTVKHLSSRTLNELPLPLPPLAEQRRIVAKLDALTARLARARAELDRVPDLSEKQHLSILRAGMRGGLSADWRESNSVEPVASTLSRVAAPQQGRGGREATDKVIPGVAGLAVNDPGTELPEGWAWVPLLRIAKQETGHTPSRSKPDYWDGGVPWIGIRDAGAHHGRYIDATAQTISEAGLANSSARLLPAGTVCLSRTASVGYVTIMARTMATSQDFATWTCTEALLPEYLMYALMAEGDEIRNFGMGTTHTTIYFPEVRAFHIALPPVEEQKEIVARIKAGLARADRLEAEATRARALLDRLESALLAKAFRGELVPQDPNDEPAQALLDRIRTQRVAAPKAKRGRKAKVTA